jgi:hypothetical protein
LQPKISPCLLGYAIDFGAQTSSKNLNHMESGGKENLSWFQNKAFLRNFLDFPTSNSSECKKKFKKPANELIV